MGNYRDLEVWQRARSFAARVDRESRQFARGNGELADQLRRSALSIPTNLAEGACRGCDGDFLRFIGIAIGSAGEADSLLVHATDLAVLDPRTSRELAEDLTVIRKMLYKLRKSVQ